MSENNDATALGEDKKKTSRHSIRRRTTAHAAPAIQEKNIEECLSTIYQDAEGTIPDMSSMTIKKSSPFARFLSIVFILGVVSAILAWAGFFLLPTPHSTTDQIDLAIEGPGVVQVGATTTYSLSYTNHQSIDLKNVTVNVYYPEGFVYTSSSKEPQNAGHNEWKLGSIAAGDQGSITIVGKYFGPLNEQKNWRAFFNYTPSNFNSELQKITSKSITINESPYSVTMTGPDQIAAGADAIYVFHAIAKNQSKQPFILTPSLPTNFQISSSSPALDKNGRWNITFTSSTDIMTSLKGKFKDDPSASSSIRAILYLPMSTTNQLFEVASSKITPSIAKSDMSLATAINGNVQDFTAQPGDDLHISINLKNTSPSDIKNAIVTLSVEGPSTKRQSALAWSKIDDPHDGDIVGEQISDTIRKGQITWNNKKYAALASIKQGDSITLDLTLPIKDIRDFDFASAKETSIKINTGLTYNDGSQTKSVAANPLTITITSDLDFRATDNVSKNSQGKEEHAISWTLTNNLHDLKNVSLTATAYGDVAYLVGTNSAGDIDYDPRTKQISWTIASMPESVDVANTAFTLVLDNKNPTQNTLLSKVIIQADDAVTGTHLTLQGKEISLK